MIDTAKLRELLAKATPGEWEYRVNPYAFGGDWHGIWANDSVVAQLWTAEERTGNASFIAAAHNAMPELLEEIDSLRAIVARLPKTADGVPVAGMDTELWYTASNDKVYCHTPWSYSDIAKMYSTREAAENARKA
jgi:hypothetical protein